MKRGFSSLLALTALGLGSVSGGITTGIAAPAFRSPDQFTGTPGAFGNNRKATAKGAKHRDGRGPLPKSKAHNWSGLN